MGRPDWARRPRALPRARGDPEPAGRGARRRRPRARLLCGPRARRRRGRCGGDGRLDDREPLLPAQPRTAARGEPIFLCAHLDTVPPEAAIEPVVRGRGRPNARRHDPRRRRQGGGRGDARGAARLVAEGRPHAGVELLFTPKEEVGLLGAAAFDESRLAAKRRLRLRPRRADRRDRPRRAAPAALDVRFHGRAAHAGMNPEDGRSAIAAAARAIADLRLGRIDEETTANVGLIAGGTARNVVPECCAFAAEARSHDERKLADLVQEMLDTFTFAASLAECEVETQVEEQYRGYRFRRDDLAVRLAASALERAGFEPAYIALGRRRRRERLQRARPPVRQPRQRDDRHPHARRADRRRRPRGDGRRHARARRRGAGDAA